MKDPSKHLAKTIPCSQPVTQDITSVLVPSSLTVTRQQSFNANRVERSYWLAVAANLKERSTTAFFSGNDHVGCRRPGSTLPTAPFGQRPARGSIVSTRRRKATCAASGSSRIRGLRPGHQLGRRTRELTPSGADRRASPVQAGTRFTPAAKLEPDPCPPIRDTPGRPRIQT
jgi:hypothetical protein